MISLLSIVPIRREPSETAEMVSQLLFAEQADALEVDGAWTRIKTHKDDYEGWVDTKMLTDIEDDFEPQTLVTSLLAFIKHENGVFPITSGVYLPRLEDETFTLAGRKYEFIEAEIADGRLSIKDALAKLLQLLNAPYLWGGRTPLGIDCSGLSQLFYSLLGYDINRDASKQIELGDEVLLDDAIGGDLAFFEKGGRVTHVGVLIDRAHIIHASGCVRVDKIDKKGIFNAQTDSYTHELCGVRRLI